MASIAGLVICFMIALLVILLPWMHEGWKEYNKNNDNGSSNGQEH